jgi:hypothetical protein
MLETPTIAPAEQREITPYAVRVGASERTSMTDPRCPICHGIGRACENHPDRPWSEVGCRCGAGMPCRCNETDGIDEPDISKIIPSPK